MRPRLLIGVAVLLAGTANAAPAAPDADVFFAFDSSSLDGKDMTTLNNIAQRAKAAPETKIVLDAHADSRGASPYNVGLSARRAKAVEEFLTSSGGIDRERIVMAMYGEDGPRRKSSALDRRVSLTLTAEPLYGIIDHSAPYATAVIGNEPLTLAEIKGPADKVPQTARR